MEDITVPVDSTGNAYFNNIDVYEGSYIEQNFTVDEDLQNQEVILDKCGVDSSLISVKVRSMEGHCFGEIYTFQQLFKVGPTTRVFFIQETDGKVRITLRRRCFW